MFVQRRLTTKKPRHLHRQKDGELFYAPAPASRTTWGVRDSSPTTSITTLFRVDLSRAGRPVGRSVAPAIVTAKPVFGSSLTFECRTSFNFTRGRTFATSIQLSRPRGRSIKGKLVCSTGLRSNGHFCHLAQFRSCRRARRLQRCNLTTRYDNIY